MEKVIIKRTVLFTVLLIVLLYSLSYIFNKISAWAGITAGLVCVYFGYEIVTGILKIHKEKNKN